MDIARVALLLALPASLSAQVVRGVVRDSATGEPAPGVLVTLVERASGARQIVLSDGNGRFTVASSVAGMYKLETKRIGVRPSQTPEFALGAGEAREVSLTVTPVVARLQAVRVTGRSFCAERVSEGAETATLWEEVRAALMAARITRQGGRFPVTLARTRRTLDPVSYAVRSEERSERTGVTTDPFSSLPLSLLSTHGYVIQEGRTLVYAGPDVEVLLSDAFVRDHCFRRVEGRRDRPGLLGLAFEPTSARTVADIAGVLWLDAATRELRRLEFSYTGLPFEFDGPQPLSYVDYARLPSGAWIVQRWALRMPHVAPSDPAAPTNPFGAPRTARHRLVAILEEAGEALVSVREAAREAVATVRGTVFDSAAGRPLAGARVVLRGTAFAATADSAGRFRIQLPDTGDYLIAFEHARLDSLGFDPAGRPVHVGRGAATVDLAVPSLGSVRAGVCPGSSDAAGVLHGAVRNATGAPAAWATLKYRWDAHAAAAPGPRPPGGTLVTDSRARYLVCDVPAGGYRFALETESGETAEADVFLEAGGILVRHLTLRRR